jgi:uncharacterized protein
VTDIYLPIAEMSVPLEVILGLGTVVGMLSSLFGVSGGFLGTPFLIFLGVPATIAVGTQANQLIASSLSGGLGHFQRGNIDIKLGSFMMIGSCLGALVGSLLFKLLMHLGHIDTVIHLLYFLLLGVIGSTMLVESLKGVLKRNLSPDQTMRSLLWTKNVSQKLGWQIAFPHSKILLSGFIPMALGFVGGMLVAIMGVGGGFFIVPALIYFFGMPILLAAGTSLFQMFFTSIFTTLYHAIFNQTVDLVLAFFMMMSGVIGAQIGLFLTTYIKGSKARLLLASLIVCVSISMGFKLFVEPSELYQVFIK